MITSFIDYIETNEHFNEGMTEQALELLQAIQKELAQGPRMPDPTPGQYHIDPRYVDRLGQIPLEDLRNLMSVAIYCLLLPQAQALKQVVELGKDEYSPWDILRLVIWQGCHTPQENGRLIVDKTKDSTTSIDLSSCWYMVDVAGVLKLLGIEPGPDPRYERENIDREEIDRNELDSEGFHPTIGLKKKTTLPERLQALQLQANTLLQKRSELLAKKADLLKKAWKQASTRKPIKQD